MNRFLNIVIINNGRPFIWKFISRFPSSYILLNFRKTGFKNALLNIRGYKAIKNNDLLDIGFYLKNNGDVRVSGEDPIIHYLYHGFNEGRKPNPNFDGDYYLETHGDVKNSNLNPLVHYSLYGINEDRKTLKKKNGAFSPEESSETVDVEVKIDSNDYSRIINEEKALQDVLMRLKKESEESSSEEKVETVDVEVETYSNDYSRIINEEKALQDVLMRLKKREQKI